MIIVKSTVNAGLADAEKSKV